MLPVPPEGVPDWLRYTVFVIQTIGFPVAVAGFVLYRLNGKFDRLIETITALRETILAHGIGPHR